ncbi:MAG: hypothetical protein Alpg2KO_14680 [Alphaproteobacteria bacterium]
MTSLAVAALNLIYVTVIVWLGFVLVADRLVQFGRVCFADESAVPTRRKLALPAAGYVCLAVVTLYATLWMEWGVSDTVLPLLTASTGTLDVQIRSVLGLGGYMVSVLMMLTSLSWLTCILWERDDRLSDLSGKLATKPCLTFRLIRSALLMGLGVAMVAVVTVLYVGFGLNVVTGAGLMPS